MDDPSTHNSFSTWFIGDGGAGWIVGIAGLIISGIGLVRRKRPNRISVVQIERASLVRINQVYRPLIKVTFAGKPATNLGETDLVIINEGSDVIRDIELTVTFPRTTTILNGFVWNPDGSPASQVQMDLAPDQLSIRLPYLNPVKEHKESCNLALFLDGSAEGMKVVGGGAGWSVSYRRPASTKQELRKVRLTIYTAIPLAILSAAYALFIPRFSKVPLDEISWRSFWIALPSLLLAAIAALLLLVRSVRLARLVARMTVDRLPDDVRRITR